jgi:iron complex outermembrane receptor protein
MTIRAALMTGAMAISATMGSTAAWAEAKDSGKDNSATVAEVIVTARRVSENVQQIPVSVTVADAATLERANVKDLRDLQNITPGIQITPGSSNGTAQVISIRGQAQADTLLTTDGSTGVYIDGVYLPRGVGLRPILGATEEVGRVEVLRGPQGTLFGRNTTGGGLNIVTKTPGQVLGGYLDAGAGNFDARDLSAGVNLPLGDNAGLRLALQHAENGGYGHDGLGQALRSQNSDYAHARLVITPNDKFTFDFSGTYERVKTGGDVIKLYALCGMPGSGCASALPGGNATVAVVAALGLPLVPANFPAGIAAFAKYTGGNPYATDGTKGAPALAEVKYFGGTLSYELADHLTLKSITGYVDTVTNSVLDLDATPFPILSTSLRQSDRFLSQELQIIRTNDVLSFVAGLYGSQEQGDDGSLQLALTPINPANPIVTDGSVKNSSEAVFGQANWHFAPRFTFTGGLRYTKETKELISRNHTGGVSAYHIILPVTGPPVGTSTAGQTAAGTACSLPYANQDSPTQCQATFRSSYSDVSWLASLDYQMTDAVLLYAKASKGFRGGGENLRGTATTGTFSAFGPETAIQYEGGVKSTFWDGRARVNAAAYYTDYKDIQRSTIFQTPTGGTGTQVSNAASAKLWGGEIESVFIPIPHLTLNASIGLFHGEYGSWHDGNLDRSDTPFSTPETTIYLGARYVVPLTVGDLSLQADYTHQSSQPLFTDSQAATTAGPCCTLKINRALTVEQKGYGLLGARVSLELKAWDAEVAIFGRNLTDQKYDFQGLDLNALGYRVIYVGDPRTFGIEFKKRFGG